MKDSQKTMGKKSSKASSISLTELLYGILSYITQNKEMRTIPRDSVYMGIFEIRNKYPNYFNQIHFVKRGKIQFSKQIEDVLFDLGASGIMEAKNPKNQYFEFSHSFDSAKENLIKWHGKKAVDVLVPMAEQFYSAIKEKCPQYL